MVTKHKSYIAIVDNSNTKWDLKIISWIEKYLKYNSIIVNDVDSVGGETEIVVMGCNLSSVIVPKIQELIDKGHSVTLISNLCSDVSYDSFINAISKLRNIGVKIIKDFHFLNDEIIKFVEKSLSVIIGQPVELNENEYFLNYNYESIELISLSNEIEDEYFVFVSKKMFGKSFKVKYFYKVLESCKLSEYSIYQNVN